MRSLWINNSIEDFRFTILDWVVESLGFPVSRKAQREKWKRSFLDKPNKKKLLTTYHLPLTTYHLLLTNYHLLLTSYFLLLTSYPSLYLPHDQPTTSYPLPTTSPLTFPRYRLPLPPYSNKHDFS
jgi:hypothetical protein